jgi:hypothetical protein
MIAHSDDAHFVVNLHALHNAIFIQKYLPRHLTAPKPLHADRQAWHHKIAALLRISQTDKRARSAAKAKATRQAKKLQNQREAVIAAPMIEERVDDDDGEAVEINDLVTNTRKRRCVD